MNISNEIVFEAPRVSYAEIVPVAPRAARPVVVTPNLWSVDHADSLVSNVAGAVVLAITGLVSLAAFAHVFLG